MVAKITHIAAADISTPAWRCRALDMFVIMTLLLGSYLALPHLSAALAAENGMLENLEVLLLFLAMLVFLYASRGAHLQSIAWFSAVICFGFILREVDIEDFDLPHWLIAIGSGKGRNALIAALSLFTLWQLYRQIHYRLIVPLLATRFAFYIYGVFIGLVFSWLFDKGVIHSDSSLILEELAEINAYALILCAAVVYRLEFRTKPR